MKLMQSLIVCLAGASCWLALQDCKAQAAPQKIQIVAERYDFVPGEVTVKRGTPITIVLTSKDTAHGIKFKEFDLVLDAKKGKTEEVTFTPDKTGTFIGQCSVFCGMGHSGMKFTLHVTE